MWLTLDGCTLGGKININHNLLLWVIFIPSRYCLLIGIGRRWNEWHTTIFEVEGDCHLKFHGRKMFGEMWCMWIFVRWFYGWPFGEIRRCLFIVIRKFSWCDIWSFHVEVVDGFYVASFDFINFRLNCCFGLWFSDSTFLPNLFLTLILSKRSPKDVVTENMFLSY